MFTALAIGLVAVVCTALIHYVTMTTIVESGSLSRASRLPRFVLMILAISVTHLVEAAVWALALGLGLRADLGALQGIENLTASDVLGFSLVNFATLGLGVLTPTEDLKFVAAMGALNGFLLITCSASFLHRAISDR